jgi:hypothetical protein
VQPLPIHRQTKQMRTRGKGPDQFGAPLYLLGFSFFMCEVELIIQTVRIK